MKHKAICNANGMLMLSVMFNCQNTALSRKSQGNVSFFAGRILPWQSLTA